MVYIYCLIDEYNQPFYVGQTRNPQQRLSTHRISRNKVDMEILETTSISDAKECEFFWIACMRFIGSNLANKITRIGASQRSGAMNQNLIFRVDQSDKERWEQRAKSQGMSLSGWLRHIADRRVEQIAREGK